MELVNLVRVADLSARVTNFLRYLTTSFELPLRAYRVAEMSVLGLVKVSTARVGWSC